MAFELSLLADQAELLAQPRLNIGNDRNGLFLTHGTMLVGCRPRMPSSILQSSAIRLSASLAIGAGPAAAGSEGPAHMRPSECERHPALVGEHAIAAIAINPQDAGEA
jgi:hypothetical protein